MMMSFKFLMYKLNRKNMLQKLNNGQYKYLENHVVNHYMQRR
jgi:hypothetical protein